MQCKGLSFELLYIFLYIKGTEKRNATTARGPRTPHKRTVHARVHGWFNPKRTLTWNDVISTPHITLRHLVVKGDLPQSLLRSLQPDVQEWVAHGSASFADVPLMTEWPLHPVRDLRGDLSTLVEQRYDPMVLNSLGINFTVLKAMGLTAEWMKMFDFSLREWVELGMTVNEAGAFTDREISYLFGTTRENLQMAISMTDTVMLKFATANAK